MFYPWPTAGWGCCALRSFMINHRIVEWIDIGSIERVLAWCVAALASVLADAWLGTSCCVEGFVFYSLRSLVNLDGLLLSLWRGSTKWFPWFDEMLAIIWSSLGNDNLGFKRSFRRWRVSTPYAFVWSQLIKSALLFREARISSLPKRGIEWRRQLLWVYVGLLSQMMTRCGASISVFTINDPIK